MSKYWSKMVEGLAPYVPGEQPQVPNLVKLNTNESPFGPSPKALDAIRAAVADDLRLYPDPQSNELRQRLAAHHKVRAENVFVGNGSDEVLAHTFVALLNQDHALRFPDITYSFYPVFCRLFGIAHEAVPLDRDMRVNINGYGQRPGPVILANPNAPTGIALSRAEIEKLIRIRSDSVVVIDEAYVDFGAETAVSLIEDNPNLLVVQTMSKSRALAGLRVGYAIGHVDLIEALTRVKDSFNSYPLGKLAQAGALASLEDQAFFEASLSKVVRNRDWLTKDLQALGFEVLPSSANFVFTRHPATAGAELAARLRNEGVLVRHFDKPRISDYVRITVGTEAQLDRLFKVLSAQLGQR